MINKEHMQQVSIGTSILVPLEKLLSWQDPHCPDSLLMLEEFSHVNNDTENLLDYEEEEESTQH
ncbi:hypothetical protein [Neptunomonas sp.]|uniref:hypothetical protein n=1 Tax=Neptunomonas sp. TaxID=1971898 RepID=UPI00356A0102